MHYRNGREAKNGDKIVQQEAGREIAMIHIQTNVASTQAYGCAFCLHVGSIAILFGRKNHGRGPRLEIVTPLHWLRWSRGYER